MCERGGGNDGWRACLWSVIPGVLFLVWVLAPDTAWAHDCSGPQDCEQTAGYNAVVSVVGAISAILAGILGSSFIDPTTVVPVTPPGPPPLPPHDSSKDDPNAGGGDKELPPGSDGWQVTDTTGKQHIFATKDDADRYYNHLMTQRDADIAKENVKQAENDYHNAAEQVEFINSVIRGLKAAGKDASTQIAEADRWARERDRLRGEVGKIGGDTDYQTRDHGSFTFGEHDDLLRQMKDSRNKLDTLQRMSNAVDSLRSKNLMGENSALTDKTLDRINKLADDLVMKGAKEPSWDDIQKIKDIIGKDMDATAARQAANQANWVRDGAAATSREIFTGVNANGETSYKSMALRGLLAAATGGQSEVGMTVADKMYGIHDDVMAGKSGLEAYANAVKGVLVDETVGRATGAVLDKGGKIVGAGYAHTVEGTAVDKWARDKIKTAGDILNKDVGAALRGSTSETAEGLEHRMTAATADKDLSHEGRSADQRQADFEAGRNNGAAKVDELKDALENRRNNPGPEADARVRDAVDEVQADKHAMHDLNGRSQGGAPDDTIHGFNKELGESYETAHQTTRERIAKEYGVPVEDVKVVKPTNKAGTDSVDVSDPRGFAQKPTGSVETDGRDFTQRRPEKPVEVKNNSASFDQDVTYRVRQDNVIDPRTGKVGSGHVDVPAGDTKRIYNEEFYKARHNGELPTKINRLTGEPEIDRHAVDHYADKMDQASTDRLHSESYGTGDRDLKTATDPRARGRDFTDVEQVGKASEHKNYEWQEKADHTRQQANDLGSKAEELEAKGQTQEAMELRNRAEALHQKAESQIEEGYRQTTKQYRNQLQSRVDEVNRQAGHTVAEVPERLQKAADIMQDRSLSPVQMEHKLAQMGYTPDKVAQQLSSNLESLQKFKPGLGGAPTSGPNGFDFGGAATDALKAASKNVGSGN